MKKICVAVLSTMVLLGGISGVEAKDKTVPLHEARFEHMKKVEQNLVEKLNLTEKQQEEAKAIHQKGRQQMKKLHEKMQELRKENMQEFENILTPEQKKKFDEIKAEHRSKKHIRNKKDK